LSGRCSAMKWRTSSNPLVVSSKYSSIICMTPPRTGIYNSYKIYFYIQRFKDQCDFGYQIMHFNNSSETINLDCIIMVFLVFLSEDMDQEGLLLII
jgi:hypothetical protein